MKVLNIELNCKLCMIRKAEDIVRRDYFNDQMKTPMHIYTGGVAICAGFCHVFALTEQIMGTYR